MPICGMAETFGHLRWSPAFATTCVVSERSSPSRESTLNARCTSRTRPAVTIRGHVLWAPRTKAAGMTHLRGLSKDRLVAEVEHLRERVSSLERELSARQERSETDRATEDLSRRHGSEAVLRESERRFQAIARATPYAMFIARRGDGRILYANEMLCQVVGFTDDPIDHYSLELYWDPGERAGLLAALDADGSRTGYELRHRKTNGEMFWAVTSSVALEFDGEPAILTSFFDVTDRRRAEEERSRNEQLLHTTIDNLPHIVFVKDYASRYLLVNRAYAEFYDTPVEDFRGLTTMTLPHPTMSEKRMFAEEDRRVFEDGETVHRHESLSFNQHGASAYFDVIKLPLKDENGRVYALVGIGYDVTERKLAKDSLERQVNERTLELEMAQGELLRRERLATVGQVTGTVAHELRNPLGTIETSIRALVARLLDPDPKVAEGLARIERNIVRCTRIIDELFDYSRVRKPKLEPTRMDQWLERVIAECDVPDAVALETQLGFEVTALVDRDRLRQGVINVVDNAYQSLCDPGAAVASPSLEVSMACRNDRLEIVVNDNGPGIDDEVRPRVFEPLYSTRSFGVGLGLPLVRQILQEHGGDVIVESAAGCGTRVTLWLPLAPEE